MTDIKTILDVQTLIKVFPYANHTFLLTLITDPVKDHIKARNMDSPMRLIHWLAQCGHETMGFTEFEELTSFKSGDSYHRYDGRMGNKADGDGAKYRGRGCIMLTGKSNYTWIGSSLNQKLARGIPGGFLNDFVNNPDEVEIGLASIVSALEFWTLMGLNKYADQDDILTITKKINGGTNGYQDRVGYLSKLKNVIGYK